MAGNSVATIMGLEFPHLHAIALKRREYPTPPGPTSANRFLHQQLSELASGQNRAPQVLTHD
jgi:hypothetical protein